MTSTDHRSIEAVIEQYRQGFLELDPEVLIDIWDPTYHSPVYVAQEESEPRLGLDTIVAYYRALPGNIPADRVVSMYVDIVDVSVLGDTAVAFALFRFEGEMTDGAAPFVAKGRTTFIFRRHDGRWKVIHYHESAPPDARPGRLES